MTASGCPAATRGEAEARPQAADIFRRFGPAYLRDHALPNAAAKALRAAIACRTAALGGHLDVCAGCGFSKPSYNSCRDRHCPTCQGQAAARWIETRMDRVLPTHHFHVVFTLPSELRPLALANGRIVYDLLFDAASATLLELGRTHLGATLGITAVLHTWTRQMDFHPHLHCVVTGGGLSLDHERWVPCNETFLFHVDVLGALFRGKFLDGLVRAYKAGKLVLAGTSAELADPVVWARLRDTLYRTKWIVYAKRPFGDAEQVIRYLGRYTHRVAISSSRLVSIDDDAIVLRTRDERTCRLDPAEFLRRFLLHVLAPGFRKIRHYGLLAPANVRTRLEAARLHLDALGKVRRPREERPDLVPASEPHTCPACKVGVLVRQVLPPARAPPGGP